MTTTQVDIFIMAKHPLAVVTRAKKYLKMKNSRMKIVTAKSHKTLLRKI